MEVDTEVRLLLRFYKNVDENIDSILQKFEDFKQKNTSHFSIKTSGTHVWLNIIGEQKKYYSPHLHLELEVHNNNPNQTHIRGLYGPDPTLWTFFMFLHFVIAGIFIIFCGILYTDYVLKNELTTDFLVLSLMLFSWFLLYFIARQIRHNGKEQMQELETFFFTILKS